MENEHDGAFAAIRGAITTIEADFKRGFEVGFLS
jgi:hypothetical protein